MSADDWTCDDGPVIGHIGLWDGRDNCWLGNEKGPLTYASPTCGNAAATVATEMFKRVIETKLYGGEGTSLKDEVDPLMSPLEAIRKIEGRAE